MIFPQKLSFFFTFSVFNEVIRKGVGDISTLISRRDDIGVKNEGERKKVKIITISFLQPPLYLAICPAR